MSDPSPSTFQLPPPFLGAALLGAASPLWAYFAGAAAGGVAVWWTLRLARPQNLEAFYAWTELPALAGVTGLQPNESLAPIAAPTAEAEIAALEAEPPFVPAAEALASEASGAAKAEAADAANDRGAA